MSSSVTSSVDADGPGAAAYGDIAPGVDEAWPDDGEQLGGPIGRVALADPAEIEADAGFELDREPADDDPAAASRRSRHRLRDSIRLDSVERAVVAGRDEGVVDGRVEAPARPPPGPRAPARRPGRDRGLLR